MAQGFKVSLDEQSIKNMLERFKDVLNNLNTIAKGNKITFDLNDVIGVIDVFINRLKSAEKQVKQMEDVMNDTSFKNSFISTQPSKSDASGISSLEDRVKFIRETVDSLAKYQFTLNSDGEMEKAIISYTNKLGKVVQETMQWKTHQQEVNGIIEKTRSFETTGYKYTDDMNKQVDAVKNIEKYYNSIDRRISDLKKKYSEVFNNPQMKQSIEDTFNTLKNEIIRTTKDPRTFDKGALNDDWRSIVAQVKQYNNLLAETDKEQVDIENRILSIQEQIYNYKIKNLTSDDATTNRNNEKISALSAELTALRQKLTVVDAIDRIENNHKELENDYNAKITSLNFKDELSARDEILRIQKQINGLEIQNLTAEDAIKKNNLVKISDLHKITIELEKQLKTVELINEIEDNKDKLDKEVIAKETSIKQKARLDEIEKINAKIFQLQKDIAREENKRDGNTEQLILHQNELINYRDTQLKQQIQLSNGAKVQYLNAEQMLKVTKQELEYEKDIIDLKSKLKPTSAPSSTGRTSSLDVFGKEIDSPLKFDSSQRDIQKWLELMNKGGTVTITKFNEGVEKSGHLVKQFNYEVKSSDGTVSKYTQTIDKASDSNRLMNNSLGKLPLTGFLENIGKAIGKLGEWALASGAVYEAMNQLRNGLRFVNELNKSLTEIGIVTYENQGQVAKYAQEYNALAQEMRVTTGEVAKASVEFFRQGLSQAEVMERMKATTQYAKISNMDFAQSAEILTATVNTMDVSIERATDTFAYLGDATSTGADEIGKAFQKVGGTSRAIGVEYEKTASWIATLSAKTRESAESVGTAINSIMLRFQQLRERGFAEEDGTKVNNVAKALNEVGIKIIDAEGNFRNFGTVMDELGAIWDTLENRQKSYISTQMAGRMLPLITVMW